MRPADHPRLFLAPGASGNPASVTPFLAAAAAGGFDTAAVALPRGRAENAVSSYRLAAAPGPRTVVGGQSFGGRVASLLAAEESYAALVLLCYPLHPPGSPERVEGRTLHWPRIRCPVLLLSGDRDPFARIDLLRSAVRTLANAELVVYPGVGHGLRHVLEDALRRVTDFARTHAEPVPG